MTFLEYLRENTDDKYRGKYLKYKEGKESIEIAEGEFSRVFEYIREETELHKRRLVEYEESKQGTQDNNKRIDGTQDIKRIDGTSDNNKSIDGTSDNNKSINTVVNTSLKSLQEDMRRFAEFIRLNIIGFKKLFKFHDATHSGISEKYSDILNRKLANLNHLDELIYAGSKLKLRETELDPNKVLSGGEFIRKTNKYWVHNDNLMALKLNIVKNLPLFVFSTSRKDTNTNNKRGTTSNNNNINSVDDNSLYDHTQHDTSVSSVYFDNSDHKLYYGRLKKDEGAEAIRIRWYGKLESPEDVVFMERKRHCEGWTGEESKKLRFKIQEKDVMKYISGKDVYSRVKKLNPCKDPSEESALYTLYIEIQEAITTHRLAPSVRTFYKRIAFQLPNDAAVRISLDTNLCMIDERETVQKYNSWYRRDAMTEWPFREVGEIVRFPYGVLEVKTQISNTERSSSERISNNTERSSSSRSSSESSDLAGGIPGWITDIINSPLVEHVHKFSKFLHGTAILQNVDEIPYWLPQMATDIRKDGFSHEGRRKEFINSNLYSVSSQDDEKTRGSTASENNNHRYTSQRGINNTGINNNTINNNSTVPRISIPVRVEPKVFFANERTFLSWVQFAIFLGGIGTAMLGLDNYNANLCGSMLIGVSIIFAFYSLYLFFWRATRIRRRDPGPYDDTKGPLILVGVFILSLLMSVYFKFPMKK